MNIDVGFQVCNPITYPNLWRIWAELGVHPDRTSMSLAIETPTSSWSSEWGRPGHSFTHSVDWLKRWCAEPLRTASDCALFVALVPLLKVTFARAKQLLAHADGEDADAREEAESLSFGVFLSRVPRLAASHFLEPMCRAIWSVSPTDMSNFPALFVLRFLANHQLLSLSPPQWYTLAGGSAAYVNAISDPEAPWAPFLTVRTATQLAALEATDDGSYLALSAAGEELGRFAQVIVATHPTAWSSWLWPCKSFDPAQLAAGLPFTKTRLFVHRDRALMPRLQATWASWNVLQSLGLSYWLHRLQPSAPRDVFVSLRLERDATPDPSLTLHSFELEHPCFNAGWAAAQAAAKAAAPRGIHLAGAWLGAGFHEDGARSALEAVQKVLASLHFDAQRVVLVPVMRACEHDDERLSTRAPFARAAAPSGRWRTVHGAVSVVPVPRVLSSWRQAALATLAWAIPTPRYGTLIIYGAHVSPLVLAAPPGALPTPAPADALRANAAVRPELVVTLYLHDEMHWLRQVASAGELGLARSYRDGAWDTPDLVSLLRWFIANEPPGNTLLSRVQNTANSLSVYRWLRNTITQSRQNIAAHYDLGNELYQRMLDPTMQYSCGIFLDPAQALDEPLEAATHRKLDALLDALHVRDGDAILEIGGGWGGLAARCKQTGKSTSRWTLLTLSSEQLAFVESLNLPGVRMRLEDYRLHAPGEAELYDGIVSCEMVEAVGAEYLDVYFETIGRLLKPGGRCVLQAITRSHKNYTDNAYLADSLNTLIFPGGCLPSVQVLQTLAEKYGFFLEHARDIGLHYVGTLAHWRRSFDAVPDAEWDALGYDLPFRRLWRYYLDICAAAFGEQKIQDYQLAWIKRGRRVAQA